MFRICCCALPLLALSVGATNEQKPALLHGAQTEGELERTLADLGRRYKAVHKAEGTYLGALSALDKAVLAGDEKAFQKQIEAFGKAAEAYRLAVTTYRKALDETAKTVQGKRNADKLDTLIKEIRTYGQEAETIRKADYDSFLAARELRRKLEEIDLVKTLLELRVK